MRLQRQIKVTFMVLTLLIIIVTLFKHFILNHMSKSAYNVKAHHRRHLLGSRQETKKLKQAIYSYSEDFTKRIKQAKGSLRGLNTSLDLSGERTLYIVNTTYFEEINKLQNLRTVFLNFTKKLFLKALPPRWYIPHSNDCLRMLHYAKGYREWRKRKCLQTFNYSYVDIQNLKIASGKSRPIFRRGMIKNTLSDSNTLIVGYLHVIKNGVFLPVGDVITNGAHISIKSCVRTEQDEKGAVGLNASALPIHEEIFSISQVHGSNFFHFTIEDLSRLALVLPFLKQHRKIKIHVNHKQSFMNHFFKALGLAHSRMVWGPVRARTLYLPVGSECGRPAVLPTNVLSLYLRHNIRISERKSIVLIQRSKKRWFKHHKAILKMLTAVAKEFHLQVEIFSDMALPVYDVTGRTFNRAIMVVAPHGAGLANLIFSRPGTCVIEGLCYGSDGKVNLCFRDLAKVLGHIYHSVVTSGQCMEMTADDFRPQVLQCLRYIFNM